MRDTFADWYFERSSTKYKEVDCAFPCNPTCPECPRQQVHYKGGGLPLDHSLF